MSVHVHPVSLPGSRLGEGPQVAPCYGVGCSRRAECRCYQAVEDAAWGTAVRGTCLRNGAHAGFRPAALRTPEPSL